MRNYEVFVSVIVPVYNHEAYIVRALDSILMQKTKYTMEILVGEDCSTDNTRAVLKEYEKNHPGKLEIFYREQNMHQIGKSNLRDLKRRSTGKYMITLEGDDFWLDPLKIEKQIDFLEKNPEYLAVAHNCVVVNKDSEPNGEEYPECKDEEYTLEHFVNGILPGQFATLMTKNYIQEEIFDTSLLHQSLSPADRLIAFCLVANGRVYCMQEIMSAYRHITDHGTSFSATYKYDFERSEKYQRAVLVYARTLSNKKAVYYAELMYLRNLLKGFVRHDISLRALMGYSKQVENKTKVLFLLIKQIVLQRSLVISSKNVF